MISPSLCRSILTVCSRSFVGHCRGGFVGSTTNLTREVSQLKEEEQRLDQQLERMKQRLLVRAQDPLTTPYVNDIIPNSSFSLSLSLSHICDSLFGRSLCTTRSHAFVSVDDVYHLEDFERCSLIVIRAPAGTTLDVPEPDEVLSRLSLSLSLSLSLGLALALAYHNSTV